MRDVFTFESPLGVLGKIANVLFLERYMRQFLQQRNAFLQQKAEEENITVRL